MKKALCLIVLLCAVPLFAMGAENLADLTIDQLIRLKTDILAELMVREEIKEVNVPAGEYIVGQDIPAGNYTVTTDSALCMIQVNVYEKMHTLSRGEQIGKLVLNNGDQVSIIGNCVFAIYQGLGF